MSSFKNASKSFQKTHKERHQPNARQHLGLLEKKKDYKRRADDYNAKKAQLQYLHKKALDRNPDEFYYHMVNSEVKDGVHHDKAKSVELTEEQVKLMQSQDGRYIGSRHVMEKRKVERLNRTLHRLDGDHGNKHTFFVDDEKGVQKFSLAKRLDTPSVLLSRKYNRPRTIDLLNTGSSSRGSSSSSGLPSNVDSDTIAECARLRRRAYKELVKRIERVDKLEVLEKKMQVKKFLQNKKRVIDKRIAPETKDAAPIYLFKQQRYK